MQGRVDDAPLQRNHRVNLSGGGGPGLGRENVTAGEDNEAQRVLLEAVLADEPWIRPWAPADRVVQVEQSEAAAAGLVMEAADRQNVALADV